MCLLTRNPGFTHGKNPIIFLATDPAPGSHATSTSFQQDHNFIKKCERTLLENFGIQYIGDWHSHHELKLDRPSLGDMDRIKRLKIKTGRERFCEIIVTHSKRKVNFSSEQIELIKPFMYIGHHPDEASIILLGEKESPIRKMMNSNNFKFKDISINDKWNSFNFKKVDFPDYKRNNVDAKERIKRTIIEEIDKHRAYSLKTSLCLERLHIEMINNGEYVIVEIPLIEKDIICYLMLEEPDLKIEQIGKVVGGKHIQIKSENDWKNALFQLRKIAVDAARQPIKRSVY